MISLCKIKGNSMEPFLKQGDYAIVVRYFFHVKKGDVVVLEHPKTGRKIVKRIFTIKNDKYFVLGDNERHSTDSRNFGWVDRRNILGKVFAKI